MLSNWRCFLSQCTGRQGRGALVCAGLGLDALCIRTNSTENSLIRAEVYWSQEPPGKTGHADRLYHSIVSLQQSNKRGRKIAFVHKGVHNWHLRIPKFPKTRSLWLRLQTVCAYMKRGVMGRKGREPKFRLARTFIPILQPASRCYTRCCAFRLNLAIRWRHSAAEFCYLLPRAEDKNGMQKFGSLSSLGVGRLSNEIGEPHTHFL